MSLAIACIIAFGIGRVVKERLQFALDERVKLALVLVENEKI